jgi:hypothetical protein
MSSNVELPPNNPNNSAVGTISQIIKAVMSLAAEAKVGALIINCRKAVPARHVLEFLGHPQPPTPMQTDNTTALGVVNQNVMKKIKIDGHEIPLAAMQNQPEAIPTFLGRRKVEPRRLLYEAPSGDTSSGNKGHFLNRYF